LCRDPSTGAVFAERELGDKKFLDYIRAFGIFEATGIDLAGEEVPRNAELKKGHQVSFATAAFGQGIEMTPLQMVRAFSVIANSGKLAEPYLVEKTENSRGEVVEFEPEIAKDNIILPDILFGL